MEMTRDDILEAIRDCLADSLALEGNAIEPGSRLIDDLGADSLDLVDIIFSLERKFRIKLKSAELDALLSADFDPSRLVDNAYIPRADVERLAEWLPAMRGADLDRVSPRELFGYITAESLMLLVERKLAAAPAAATT